MTRFHPALDSSERRHQLQLFIIMHKQYTKKTFCQYYYKWFSPAGIAAGDYFCYW